MPTLDVNGIMLVYGLCALHLIKQRSPGGEVGMRQGSRQMEPLKEYYIAYFDLLGYRAFFRDYPDKVEGFLQTIHNAISDTKDYLQQVILSPIGGDLGKLQIRSRVFSDNVLLCLEKDITQIEYARFLAFLSIVANVQQKFVLQYGLFLRGGITIGELSFSEELVGGQGVIDAVDLESRASYPRMILGKAALDYVFQTHFVRQEDLDRACEIERRAYAEGYVSDEELAFCNSIKPAVDMEKKYLQWRNQLLISAFDREVCLNYLCMPNIGDMFDRFTLEQLMDAIKQFSPNDYQRLKEYNSIPERILEQHKQIVMQQIKKCGQYSDLDATSDFDIKKAEERERILKKYIWVLMFHNLICMFYGIPKCRIKSGSTCDVRFMRMTVEIYEDDLSQIENKN